MPRLQKNLQPLVEQGKEILTDLKAPTFEYLAVGEDGKLQVSEDKARLRPASEDLTDFLDEDKLKEKVGCQLGPFQDGSVLFAGPKQVTTCEEGLQTIEAPQCNVNEDNENFFWDGRKKRLGLGINKPRVRLHVVGDGRFDEGDAGAPPARLYALGDRVAPATDGLTLLAAPSAPQISADRVKISSDGVWAVVAEATTDTFHVYRHRCDGEDDVYELASSVQLDSSPSIQDVTISGDGFYVLVSYDGGDSKKVAVYQNQDGGLTRLGDLSPVPTGAGSAIVQRIAISSDGRALGLTLSSGGPTVRAYRLSADLEDPLNDEFVEVDVDSTAFGSHGQVAMSGDGEWLIAEGSTGGGTIKFFKFGGSLIEETAGYTEEFSTVPGSGSVVDISTDSGGVYTAVYTASAPAVLVYKRTGGKGSSSFTLLSSPLDEQPVNSNGSVGMSGDSRILAVGSGDTPFIRVYLRDGDSFDKIDDPDTLPGDLIQDVSLSSDGIFMAVSIDTGGTPRGYRTYKLEGTEIVSGIAIFSDGALRVEDFTLRGNDAVLWIRDASDSEFASLKAANLFVIDKIGIGTDSPATSAALEISSTTGALLLSRMTTAQRDALTAVNGMALYNSTLDEVQFREAGSWISLVKDHDDLGGVTSDQHHAQQHGSADHDAQSDAEAIHDNVAGEIAAITEKSSPVAADLLLIEDSEASNAKKRVQVGNLPGDDFLVVQVLS